MFARVYIDYTKDNVHKKIRGQMILPFKHKWQLTLLSSVVSCYIKRKKINNDGVDIDGFPIL